MRTKSQDRAKGYLGSLSLLGLLGLLSYWVRWVESLATEITRFEDVEARQSACEVARKSNQQSTIINPIRLE